MKTIADEIYVVSHIVFWKIFGKLYWGLRRTRCWFTGHDVCWGECWTYEPNYCPKCYVDWPTEQATLPALFNKGYCWLVERDCQQFDQLDEWLSRHVSKRWWPSWWEY